MLTMLKIYGTGQVLSRTDIEQGALVFKVDQASLLQKVVQHSFKSLICIILCVI